MMQAAVVMPASWLYMKVCGVFDSTCMSTSDAFMSFSRCSMSKPPRGSGRYGTPATVHS